MRLVNARRTVSPIEPFFVEDWVKIAVFRLDGVAATWANALLLEVSERETDAIYMGGVL